MVVPMIKYSFLLLESEHEKFLNLLGELGVVDVTINNYTPSGLEIELIGKIKDYQGVHNRLMSYCSTNSNQVKGVQPIMITALELIEGFESACEQSTALKDKIQNIEIDMQEALPWGEFSLESIKRLEDHGLRLRYFSIQQKYFAEIEQQYAVSEVSISGGSVYFVMVERDGEALVSDIKNAREWTAPKSSYSTLRADIDALYLTLESVEKSICEYAVSGKVIIESIEQMKDELNYNQVKNSNARVADDSLVVINGWCVEEKSVELESKLERLSSTIVFRDRPTIDDNPPVLLRNNRFSRSAEIITKLYALPRYNEVDMTPFFAPFFIFFVGLCVGDAGYGLFLLVAALIAKTKIRKPDLQNVANLVMFCGISCIICGTAFGVFFGEELPKMALFAPVKDLFISSDDMFGISMMIGVVQILYAITLRAVIRMKRYGILYGFSGLGWVLTVISSAAAYVLPEAGVEWFSFNSVAYYIVIAVSFAMMLLFHDPRKNIFMNFGMGLWELYNNITGLLGDVLSYLRLFALGLTGGVIAGIFNQLAIGMSGDIPVLKYLIMILILLMGHSINMFIGFIGAFVHPLRLTFVEFYKNVGFEGGGKAYNPFKRKNN